MYPSQSIIKHQQGSVTSERMLQTLESLYCYQSGFKKTESLNRKIRKLAEYNTISDLLILISRLGCGAVQGRIPELADSLTNNETYFFCITHIRNP